MNFEDNTFDLVCESTMFVQIFDDYLSQKISNEILRVTKHRGYIMLSDWRYNKPNNQNYRALSRKRISHIFRIGSKSELCGIYKGALVPPVGRFLSRRMPFAYFTVQFILPFLVGQLTTILRKY